MKKTLSTKRLTKRKTNKDILLLKNFNAEIEIGKDILQVVQEKLLLDSQSVWHGAEILYVVESLKRNKTTLDQSAQAKANGKSKTPKSKSYLIILKRKDTGINVLILTLKDGDLELKNNCEPKFLRGIDFGSEENEILLSFDSGDLNIFLTSQTDRDEAVWVIFQICKCIIGNDVSLGYSIDIEAISFKTTTNSTLARFPVLNKLISAKNIQTGDVFSDEEAEAEHLLDELNWSAGSNGLISQQADLQLLLSAQSDQLKTEIIDFLLQWEEMDSIQPVGGSVGIQQQQQQQGTNHLLNLATIKNNIADLKKNIAAKVPVNPFNMHANANAAAAAAASATSASVAAGGGITVTGVRDTREVLNALTLVDNELEAVDQWLGEQIERLSEIKVNLSMIEDESGALETSWKNLNNVQEIIQYIVRGYSLSQEHQDALRKLPEQHFGPVLKGNSLQGLSERVAPLVEALTALRKALALKSSMNSSNVTRLMRESQGESLNELETTSGIAAATISPAQWKQLQAIAAISTQRVKLSEISEMFCKNFGEFSLGVYDSILKHKALSDPASPSTIAIKQFAFQSLVDEFVLERFEYEIHNRKIDFSALRTPLKMATQKNQFLNAVKAYHSAVSKFSPLLDIFMELAPQYDKPICECYVKSTQERLYVPLAKTLFKDLQSIVQSGKSMKISLASCANYRLESHKKTNAGKDSEGAPAGGVFVTDANLVRFRHDAHSAKNAAAAAKSGGAISSWMALRVALIILAPVFETEERFLNVIFHNTRHFVEQGGHRVVTLAGESAHTFNSSKLANLLQAMFDPVVTRFETHILHCIGVHHAGATAGAPATATGGASSSSSDGMDGIEAIAMLTVLKEFSMMYVAISPFQNDMPAALEKRQTISFSESSENLDANDDAPTAHSAPAQSHHNGYYLIQVLETLQTALLTRVHQFVHEQINWINAQKYDPKSPNVLLPFAKFPTLICQVMEMTNGMQFDHVDDMLHKLAKELFSWLTLTSKQSDKYCDKIKITNFTFFEKSVAPMNIAILENFVTFAAQQKSEAVARYVNWMVSYEFPALSALAVRMDGVGSRVNEEELSLYIRRKDVLNVVKEVENVKVLEANIVTLRKRLEKHFLCESYMELNLVPKGWQHIKTRVVSILSRLEDAASASYQISLDVGPKVVQDLFDKHSNNTMVL